MPRARSSLSFSTIFALSQSMTWFSFTAWSVRAEPHISLCDCLFLSLVYTVDLLTFSASDQCSLTRTSSFLFVSPTYFLSHPLQSMVYTPSLGSVLSLGWTRRLFRVGPCCKGKPCHRLGECEDSRKRKGRSSSRHKRSDIHPQITKLEQRWRGIPSIPFIRQPPWGSRTHLEGEGEQRLQKLAQYYHHLAVIHLLQYCVITVLKKSPGWWWKFDM